MKMIEPQPSNGSGNGHAIAARTAVAVNAERVNPENLAFVEDLYYQLRTDPASVDPAWRSYFESLDTAGEPAIAPPATFKRSIFAGGTVVPLRPKAAASVASERVQRLVEAYREHGHLSADLDPLGLVKRAGAQLALEDYGLSDADLDTVFSSENVAGPDRTTLRGSGRAAARDLLPAHRRRAGAPARRRAARLAAEPHGEHAQPPGAEPRRAPRPAREGDRAPRCSSSSCRRSSSARSASRWRAPRA